MPAKMAENLHTDWLATFETYVIPFSEGRLAGEIPRNVTVNIEGHIVPLAAAGVSGSTVSTCLVSAQRQYETG